MHVQQNNLAQLFKEATETSAEMLIKPLSDENTICFLTYCWMFNSDFFSCPTILRIRALFPTILQVLNLLSLLSDREVHSVCHLCSEWSGLLWPAVRGDAWWPFSGNTVMRGWTEVIEVTEYTQAVLDDRRVSLTNFKVAEGDFKDWGRHWLVKRKQLGAVQVLELWLKTPTEFPGLTV